MADASNKATTMSSDTAQAMQANLNLKELGLAEKQLAIKQGELKLAQTEAARRYEMQQAQLEEQKARREQAGQNFQQGLQNENMQLAVQETGQNLRQRESLDQRTNFFRSAHRTQMLTAMRQIQSREQMFEKEMREADRRADENRRFQLQRDLTKARIERERGALEADLIIQQDELERDLGLRTDRIVSTLQDRIEKFNELRTYREAYGSAAAEAAEAAARESFTGSSKFTRMVDKNGDLVFGAISKDGTAIDFMNIAAGLGLMRSGPDGEPMVILDPETYAKARDVYGSLGGFQRKDITDRDIQVEVWTRLQKNFPEWAEELGTDFDTGVARGMEYGRTKPPSKAMERFENVAAGILGETISTLAGRGRNLVRSATIWSGLGDPEVVGVHPKISSALILNDAFDRAKRTVIDADDMDRLDDAQKLLTMGLNNPDAMEQFIKDPDNLEAVTIAYEMVQSALDGMAYDKDGYQPEEIEGDDIEDVDRVRRAKTATRRYLSGITRAMERYGYESPEDAEERIKGFVGRIEEASPEDLTALVADPELMKGLEEAGVPVEELEALVETRESMRELFETRSRNEGRLLDMRIEDLEQLVDELDEP